MDTFPTSKRNQIRQAAKRADYDQAAIYSILDQTLLAQVAFCQNEQPFCIPMLFARIENELIFHGSQKSRLMQMLCSGQPICISATILNGLVMAKSLFHHSMNYRSVTAFGIGKEINDETLRMSALKAISDKVMAGRWEDSREPNPQEMKATCVATVPIESASAKIRTGPPSEAREDINLPYWSGVIPIQQVYGSPLVADAEIADASAIELPDYMRDWLAQHNKPTTEN